MIRKHTRRLLTLEPSAADAGYGRPPPHSRFKPGQSGNPKGRPPGTKSSAKRLQAALRKKVAVNVGGVASKMEREQALWEGLLRDALTGDNAARRILIAEIRRWEDADDSEKAIPSQPALSQTEDEILEQFRQEVLQEAGLSKATTTARSTNNNGNKK